MMAVDVILVALGLGYVVELIFVFCNKGRRA